MAVHEFKRRGSEIQRRVVPSSVVARKFSGQEPAPINRLIRRVGNQGIQRLMGEIRGYSNDRARSPSPVIQAKLAVSQPADAYEHEADRVADAVMRMPGPGVQEMPEVSSVASPSQVHRMCNECDEEQKQKTDVAVQRKVQAADAPLMPTIATNVQGLHGRGSALPQAARAFFEPRFGVDFGGVRLHTDERANATAASIGAKAYTLGRDIAFASGQYAPNSTEGRRLLAHELTHVVQQTGVNGTPDAAIQRKVDEQAFARQGGKIEEVGDTRGGGFGEGTAESNEFLLWNYDVSSPDLRSEHAKYLKDKVLNRWPALLRGDPGLKVAIVGGASSTGGAAVTTPLSVARADKIKAVLVSGGIDASRIVTSGIGSRHPFADETSSENMARNRRVEVFLFRPIQRVASQSGVSVTVTNLSAAVETGFDRDISNPALLKLRWKPFIFTADVQATGPANMTVGILQLLRTDSRVGTYRSTTGGGNFILDFGRCMQPDLPCKDVAESMGRFSGRGRLDGPGSGKVSMDDNPNYVAPIQVTDPKGGTLIQAHWEMGFIAVIGALVGNDFLPVKSVIWRLEDDHAVDSSGALNPTKIEAKAEGPQDGAPADLAIEKAMGGRTCRFMARRMNDFCKPELG